MVVGGSWGSCLGFVCNWLIFVLCCLGWCYVGLLC